MLLPKFNESGVTVFEKQNLSIWNDIRGCLSACPSVAIFYLQLIHKSIYKAEGPQSYAGPCTKVPRKHKNLTEWYQYDREGGRGSCDILIFDYLSCPINWESVEAHNISLPGLHFLVSSLWLLSVYHFSLSHKSGRIVLMTVPWWRLDCIFCLFVAENVRDSVARCQWRRS